MACRVSMFSGRSSDSSVPSGRAAKASSVGAKTEGTFALERLDQTSGLDSGDESGEGLRADRGRDEVVRAGQDHGVDDVDDAVAAEDVGHGDARAVDADTFAGANDVDALAVQSASEVELDDLLGRDCSGNHVVGEDCLEQPFVLLLQQRLERALGQRGEGGIGGSKHGEGPFALQRVDELSGGQGGGQGVERASGDGSLDDVFRRIDVGGYQLGVLLIGAIVASRCGREDEA
jgi:hypothetical protein